MNNIISEVDIVVNCQAGNKVGDGRGFCGLCLRIMTRPRLRGPSVVAAAVMLLVLSGMPDLAAAEPAWPVYRGDSQLRGASSADLREPLTLEWSFRIEGAYLSPAVVAGGNVFVGSSDDHLYCLNLEDGRVEWKTAVGDDIEGSPLVDGELVVAGTGQGVLHAVDRHSGKPRWTFESDDRIVGGPNSVSVDGKRRIVFGSHDMHVYCLDAQDGRQIWRFKTENFVNATPAVAPDGIVFGGCDGFLHVLNPSDGTSAAAIEAGSYVAASVAVDQGTAFLGHYGGDVMAVDLKAQKLLWRHSEGRRGEPFFAPPAVAGNRVVVGNRDGTVSCLARASGEIEWRFRTRNAVEAGAVIASDRCIVASTDGRVYSLDLASGKDVWSYDIGAGVSVSPAVCGSRLLVSAEDGVLYVFRAAD